MVKKYLLMGALVTLALQGVDLYDWKPQITEKDLEVTINRWETCYQYAERKVAEMKQRYSNRRIVGSTWLSAYWAHHYESALIYRNYFWLPA